MQNLGRNDLCWCGSGIKYKRCHLNRERQPPASPWELAKRQSTLFQRKVCMHPQAGSSSCSAKVIRAHSVSRAASLKPIARDGHVYQVHASLDTLIRTGGKLDVQKVGINQASTFYGFCALHDSHTFAPLEVQPFTATDEQIFLLVYRPLTKELYLKEAAVESLDILRETDKGKSLDDQFSAQSLVFMFGLGSQAALARLKETKVGLDKELTSGDYTHVRSCVIYFDVTPDIVCSGVLQPEWDFQGNRLQDIGDLTLDLDWVSLSILPTLSGGAAVFAWHQNQGKHTQQFVESLLKIPHHRIADAVVRLCFEGFENIFMAPAWWEGLSDLQKKKLKQRAMSGLPSTGTTQRDLMDDGERYVAWNISGIVKNY